MNKIAIITAFLGGVKNRYIQYQGERTLEEKFRLASGIEGVEGFELCYPADFENPAELKRLLSSTGFGVASVNIRSRRNGKWLRGAFSSSSAAERREVVEDFSRAVDLAREVGSTRVSTCPLNDGHDYVFEMDYPEAYRCAEETFAAICDHDPKMKVCIEYKQNDPMTRCLLASAGETAAFCGRVGKENLGATMDFGHSLLAGERPAQAAALLHRAGRLFYVHLNDNDRLWDWDMLPGAFNVPELVEFLYWIKRLGYTDDWYAFDVMSKETSSEKVFRLVAKLTRRAESMAEAIDPEKLRAIQARRDPADAVEYLWDTVFQAPRPQN